MKELIIDRFEEGYVVCETPTGGFDAIPRKNLPPNAEEGAASSSMMTGTSRWTSKRRCAAAPPICTS